MHCTTLILSLTALVTCCQTPPAAPPGETPLAGERAAIVLLQGRQLFVSAAVGQLAQADASTKAPPPVVAAPKRSNPDYAGQLAAALTPDRTIVYKKVGGRELRLFVFLPPNWKPTDRRVCFFSIHGGGWTGLGPYRQYPFAAHFAGRGMVGICIEYRLAKGPGGPTTVFDCVRDSRSALRYVRGHAGELGIDPERIVANGGSAGGHLAAGTALFNGVDEPGEDTSVSCIPNALVLYFPVIDTSGDGYGLAKIGSQWKELSPVHQVRPGVPSTLILHGTGDTVTPFAGAQAFQQAMRAAGNRCDLIATAGAVHGYLMRDREAYEKALSDTEAFLRSLSLWDD